MDTVEDYRITPQEESHSRWIIQQIKKRHPNEIFTLERWNQKIDWESIEKQAEHVRELATYMHDNDLPPLLHKSYIDLLHTSLVVLRDLFFVNTGFYLELQLGYEIQDWEDFKKLRFWTLRDIEVTTRLRNIFEGIMKFTLEHDVDFEEKSPWEEIEETLHGVDSTEDFLRALGQEKFKNIRSWMMTYVFAPYENREGVDSASSAQQKIYIHLYALLFFKLFFQLSVIYQTEEEKFSELVEDFSQSEMGENRIRGWRNDMRLPLEDFLIKLEADRKLKPWVRDYLLVKEGKCHLRSLYVDPDNSEAIDYSKCCNTDNWINILVIAAVLKEYDEHHQVVSRPSSPKSR